MMGSLALRVGAAVLLITACGDRQPSSGPQRDSSFAVADSLRDDGRFLTALPLYRALRDSFEHAGDSANLWRAELWWAYTLIRTNRTDSAQTALGRAMQLAGGDLKRTGWTHAMRCSRYSRIGQSDSAITECGRSLSIAEQIQDRELEALVHFQLGTIHSRLGHFRIAVAETERTLDIQRRFRHSPRQVVGTLNSMGIEYAAVGRLGEAERMYQEAIRLADSLRSVWYAYHLQSNLAYLRLSTGDLDEALRLMSESLRGAEQLPDTQGMVYAHNSLAEFYLRAGNRSAARYHLERSIAMNQRVAAIYRVIALLDLGLLQAAESSGGQPRRTLLAAMAAADTAGFGAQRVASRAALARLAAETGDRARALRWANEAVSLADSLEAPEAQIDALDARARALEAGQRSDASDGYLRGIELLESWRGRLALGDLRMGVAEPRWGVYEGAIRTLLRQGRSADAFLVAERARARLLLEVMAERDASRPTTSRADELRRRLRQRFEERAGSSRVEDQAALDREIAELTGSLATAEANEKARVPGGAARFPSPASVARLRGDLLTPGRALLAVFWGDSAVYGWWVTQADLRAARLGASDSLSALVDFLRGTIDHPTGWTWTQPARLAFDRFIAPLKPTPVQELLVVADGPLAHVPIEVLIPAEGAAPWGATTRFIYGPSASVLLALNRAPKPAGWARTMLAVGNPTSAARWPGLQAERSTADSASAGLLPYAGSEARAIRDLFRDVGADLLLGPRATPARWLRLDPARYRYLHFAAHARVSDRRPDQTYLVLSGGNLDLTAIRRLQLRADLVTLSACETALGRRVRGEGIIGLPHAFLAAGAQGAVVTLWRIADRSAADFMRAFYQELRAGHRPADALLAVRRRWIAASGPAAHPAHWAPFVLVGGIAN